MLWKCCPHYASKFGKLSSGHRSGEDQFSIFQRKAMTKNVQTTAQLRSSHTLAKWCLKFSKPGFNSMWTMNFQMFKLVLEKAEEAVIKLPTSTGSLKKKRVLGKHQLLLHWLCQSLWLCGSQQTVENSQRDGNSRPPHLPPKKSVCMLRSNSLNWTWTNRLVPNQERSMSRLYIVTLLI